MKPTGSRPKDKKKNLRRTSWLYFALLVAAIVFVNIIGHYLFARLDLSTEKRYTLHPTTKQLLRSLDEPVLFRIYLEGDFPSDYQRLQNETRDMLNQFRAYSRYVEYEFVDPNAFETPQEQQTLYQKLAERDIQASYIQVRKPGGITQQTVIPAADVHYKGRETSISLLQSQAYVSNADQLNNSIKNLEYVLSSAIRGLSRAVHPKIGFLVGHGELQRGAVYDIQRSLLLENYRVENVLLDNQVNALTTRSRAADSSVRLTNKYDVLIVPKPTQPFTDQELYLIDQYVMYGGKVLWLIDALDADLDSLAEQQQSIVTRLPLTVDEMLFNYGVRVCGDLVMDIRCRPIPMAVGMVGDKPQIDFRPWLYFPDIIPTSQHPIVRNLDIIKTDFVSSIDLIDNEIDKTVLLSTSEYSRIKNAPLVLDLNEANVDINKLDQRLFNRRNIPVAVLLEGEFKSMWRSRLAPEFASLPEMGFRNQSERNKMIVISDGDMIKNRFNYKDNSSYPLGYDYYTETMYANKQFLLNAIDYLAGEEESLATRSREVKLRKLDPVKTAQNRTLCQWVNTILPVALIALIAPVVILLRRRGNIKKQKNKETK